ncbi:hypothetical protein DFJ74DRAFT_737233 [Hyaloraphidium curvatum]|nr:hypothetical protein DFJ74DRAFT_737233 [Hyaloraphidium curvatum]
MAKHSRTFYELPSSSELKRFLRDAGENEVTRRKTRRLKSALRELPLLIVGGPLGPVFVAYVLRSRDYDAEAAVEACLEAADEKRAANDKALGPPSSLGFAALLRAAKRKRDSSDSSSSSSDDDPTSATPQKKKRRAARSPPASIIVPPDENTLVSVRYEGRLPFRLPNTAPRLAVRRTPGLRIEPRVVCGNCGRARIRPYNEVVGETEDCVRLLLNVCADAACGAPLVLEGCTLAGKRVEFVAGRRLIVRKDKEAAEEDDEDA